MTSYALHPGALSDIEEIWAYIADDNLTAADGVVSEIFASCAALASFPNQGHWRDELAPRRVRFKTVRSYLIAYASDVAPIRILAVIHGRRHPNLIASTRQGRQAGW